jgi:hypothetical protein
MNPAIFFSSKKPSSSFGIAFEAALRRRPVLVDELDASQPF